MEEKKEIDLVDCILATAWPQATKLFSERPNLLYSRSGPLFHVEDNEGDNELSVSPLHQLFRECCRTDDLNGSLSDDSENDEDEQNEIQIYDDWLDHNESDNSNDNNNISNNNTNADMSVDDSNHSMNNEKEKDQMYELAKLMIQTSHDSFFQEQCLARGMDIRSLSALRLTEGVNETPLHVICSLNTDSKLIRIIFESIKRNSQQELTGITGIRCWRGTTVAVPSALELVTAQNGRGCTPLHYIAGSRFCDFSTVEHVLEACHLEQQQTNHKSTILSSAMDDDDADVDDDVETTQTCLEQALMLRDEDGDTSLHWACSAQTPVRIVKLFIEYGGFGALNCANNMGECPMDMFARECREEADLYPHRLPQIWTRCKEYISAIDGDNYIHHQQNKQGKTILSLPIHAMAATTRYVCPLFILDLALEFQKEQLVQYDSQGMLPLHIALSNGKPLRWKHDYGFCSSEDYFIMKILEANPDALKMPSRDGRSPLHHAAKSRNCIAVINRILSDCPSSIYLKDPVTGLCPSLLAATGQNNTLESVYKLIRTDPAVICDTSF